MNRGRSFSTAMFLAQQRRKLLRRNRPTEIEPLRLLATVRFEERNLLDLFHALGNRFDTETASEVDDRLDDRLVFRIVRETSDEGLIDLQLVGAESLEVTQRGIAGAEVIDRDAHTECVELVHDRDGTQRVVGCDPLGQFELQITRINTGFAENPAALGKISPGLLGKLRPGGS